jgi:formate hydrogenlyase subunit 4
MLFEILQALFIVAIAPLMTGIIRKLKALLQSRRGPGIFQPYYDLLKLFRKESVVSRNTSWVFRVTPCVCMASALVAALLVPVFITRSLGFVGDLIVFIYLLAMARFFMALAALDAGSAFGGMGSSREMAISSLAEPTMLLSIFAMALLTGTTSLGDISARLALSGPGLVGPSLLLAAAAFFIIMLAENARLPIDNPSTHLELTMIHEAMLLEYSGKQLALMELSSMVKLTLFFAVLSSVFMPWGIATEAAPSAIALGLVVFLAKALVLAGAIALIESSMAKMRLFRVPNLLTVSFTVALLAIISYYIL